MHINEVSTDNFGTSSQWFEAFQKNVVSASYDEITEVLTLTMRDNTTVTVTIPSGGGGDFVPIAGNAGNPMTGPLVMQRIETNGAYKNISIGNDTPDNNNDDDNICIGRAAGNNINNGQVNIAIGDNAGRNIATGSENVCIGQDAGLGATTTSSANTYVGKGAGSKNNGSQNIMIGVNSDFKGINTGDYNVIVGSNGANDIDITSHSGVICIGRNSQLHINDNNGIAIGSNGTLGRSAIEGKSTGDVDVNFIKINGYFNVKDWQFKQVTTGLNIYYNNVFKARIGTDGDLYLAGTQVHYGATE